MVELTETVASDPLLRGLIEARDEDARRAQLERILIDHAQPIVASVIARFVRSEKAVPRDSVEDVEATVMMRLMTRLRAIDAAAEGAIRDFEGYVATLTYRTIYDFMRERYPERTRLKNRLRYLLEHDARFALWTASGELVCGVRAWIGRTDTLEHFTVARAAATRAMLDRERPHEAVGSLFARAGRPIALETLVAVVAELWDVQESQHETTDDRVQAPTPSPAAHYETRQFLESLWNEIALLPPNQRIALLLNLREPDGVNAVALIAFTGVARFADIADVVNMSETELKDIWSDLPLDDLTIAARLGVTRQQVINLRRSARDRLSRRMTRSKYDGRRP